MWKRMNIKKRIGILAVIGLIVGGFIQGEVNQGTFPGIYTAIGIFIVALIFQQGFADGVEKS
jgi:hypothetical protein